MIQAKKDVSLRAMNSFGIEVEAPLFYQIESEDDLLKALSQSDHQAFILGGGSNILFTQSPSKPVLKIVIKGIQVIEESEEMVLVEVGAGEVWHDFVKWALTNDYGGIENLSLIPGTVGASPIQNIGAYGVELKNVFHHLEAIEIANLTKRHFSNEACEFGYRDSVFKGLWKDKLVITKVIFQLSKKGFHTYKIGYGAIQSALEGKELSIHSISKAIVDIRQRKLPDPKIIGNAGSFFKNPEISAATFNKLQSQFPELVFYALEDGRFKIPAGWLIDQAGWKGKRIGETGTYPHQALVIINHGKASGAEIFAFAMQVKSAVLEKFGLHIHPEVNIC